MVEINAKQLIFSAKDSLLIFNNDSLKTIIFYEDNYFIHSIYNQLDTNLAGIEEFDQTNKFNNSFATSSNVGLPHKSLFFKNVFVNNFNIGDEYQKQYLFSFENIPNYILNIPYSEIKYVMGKNNFNYLNFSLANQISKGLFFGTDINVESALGTFVNQASKNTHFRTILKANSKDGKYEIKFNYLRNHLKWGENGGLVDDFYYEDTTKLDRRIIKVNSSNASNLINSNNFRLTQSYTFRDTIHNFGGLFLDAEYNSTFRIYSDIYENNNYYNNSFLDSLASFDSTSVRDFKTSFGWKRISDSKGLSYQGGIQYSYNQYYSGASLYTLNYLVPQFKIRYNGKKSEINAFASYNILKSFNKSAYNNDKVSLMANYIREFKKDFKLILDEKFYSGETEFMNLHYFSNHFIWNNNFAKQVNWMTSGTIDFKGFQLNGKYQSMNKYIYFTDSIYPIQYSGLLNMYSISVNKEIRYNKLEIDFIATYQKVNNNSVMRVPEIMGKTSLYIDFAVFNGKLQINPGMDLTYLSPYYADGYNPAAMVFYIQNSKKIDDQIYADIFLNFKIKSARIFFLYKNINMLFGKYNYYMIAHYPQPDAGLKFGLSWRFMD